MSLRIMRTFRPGSSVERPCPRCGEEMHRDCNSDETSWWWQCQNPECNNQIPLEGDGTDVDLTPIDEPRGG
jgi:predicted RNA-binding Zn-ribbon protein involved in translation (DUF1610 family)